MNTMEYRDNIISTEEQSNLIEYIDSKVWSTKGNRRVQSYGYEYNNYTREVVDSTPIDGLLKDIMTVVEDVYLIRGCMQCYINEYTISSSISDHIDPCVFGDKVAIISLIGECDIVFTHNQSNVTRRVHLNPRSILVFEGVFRWRYNHKIYIPDDSHLDYRRISITFRCLS